MSCLDYYNRLLTGLPIPSLFCLQWSTPSSEWLSMTQLIVSIPCLQSFHGLPSSRPQRQTGSSLQICFLSHPMQMVFHPSQMKFPSIPCSCKCCFFSPASNSPSPLVSMESPTPRSQLSWGSLPHPLSAPTLCVYASLQFWLHCDCQVLSGVKRGLGHPSYEGPDT